MATAQLPQGFREFLKSFEDEGVQYLLIGGYAVGCCGHDGGAGANRTRETTSRSLARRNLEVDAGRPYRVLCQIIRAELPEE